VDGKEMQSLGSKTHPEEGFQPPNKGNVLSASSQNITKTNITHKKTLSYNKRRGSEKYKFILFFNSYICRHP